ncbi:MAG: hypothetical protein JWM63_3544 [Gammaproteobacteria bacterium]|jgi:lysophospholipid acyltransferase (LPLAT)-like uncharacterized protein|nr:hypothetical protein [Gammaproteobacteria bacterium]
MTPTGAITTPATPRKRRPVREFAVRWFAPPLARRVYSLLGGSWRYVTENEAALTELLKGDRPVVGAFLHARTFQLLHYFSEPQRGRWMLMCSKSKDGDLMTSVEEGLGYRVARGSSGSGGARALAEMIKAQREDRKLNSCLAVDGSRGPRGVAQLGILTLARKANGVLLPVAASTSTCWVNSRSWDRTVIPKPRAEVRVLIGDPIDIPPQIDAAQTEALRFTLEQRLIAMHVDLDSRTGYTDTQPLQAV